MTYRGRWSDQSRDFVGSTPRPVPRSMLVTDDGRRLVAYDGPTKIVTGVLVQDEPSARPAQRQRPVRQAQHVHVHLPGPAKTRDQGGGTVAEMPLARRDQTTAPETVGFEGPGSVDLRGRDQHGRYWGVRIYGPAGEENGDQDPDAVIADKDGNPDEYERRLGKAIAPTADGDRNHVADLRGLAEIMRTHYERR